MFRRNTINISLIIILSLLFVRFLYVNNNPQINKINLLNDNQTCSQRVMHDFDCEEEGCVDTKTLFNYRYFYTCGPFPKPITIILYLFFLYYILSVLGNTADEYFCSVLQSVVVLYSISPNTAGVTFLSFGNGAADVFSLIASFMKNKPELGLSGVIGSCFCTTTIVAGLILSIDAVTINPFLHIRNLSFFVVGIVFIFIIYCLGSIYVWEAIIFVLLYFVFVMSVIFIKPKSEKQSYKERLIEFDIHEAKESSKFRKSEADSFERISEGGISTKPPKRVRFEERPKWRRVFTLEGEYKLGNTEVETDFTFASNFEIYHWKDVFRDALNEIKEVKWYRKPMTVLLLPLVVLRKITIPILDEEDYSYDMNLIGFFLLPSWCGINLISFKYWHIFIYIVLGALFAFLCFKFTKDDFPPKSKVICTIFLIGSALSCILWIFNLAKELVNVLQTTGKALHLSDQLMGFSVLAFGNAIDDFIADVSLAKQGFGSMALTGAFCSPMFQLLFGLGCGLIIQTINGNTNIRGQSETKGFVVTVVVFCGILISIISNMILPVKRNNTYPQKFRYVLYALYAIIIFFVLLVEFGAIKL